KFICYLSYSLFIFVGKSELKTLVNKLEKDKLKDLVNKLDHHKLEIIAQDLTDPSRIKVIIDSLIDPEKLRIFAHNMSDEQFAELLNSLDAEELKDIIHKLPYEKVISVFGQSGDKSQLDHIVRILEEKLEDQFEQNREVIEMLKQIKEDMPYFAHDQNFTAEDGGTYPYDSSILV
ncbi:MAG: hypothetical protein KTV72_01180, partial [Wolbachia endosymbiont of Melophagus ovinus]|nr:hypothetical protein [Wolbachia endosymbiont of Melophagus ovinus]